MSFAAAIRCSAPRDARARAREPRATERARIAGIATKFNPTLQTGHAHCACRNRRARGSVALQGGAMASTRKTAGAAAPRTHDAVDRDAQRIVDAGRATPRAARGSSPGPHFLGHIVHHAIADPRDARTILAAARTGHLGPTIFRSTDRGRTWKEAAQPPAFEAGSGRTVDHSFWLHAGPRDRARRLVRGHVAARAVPFDRRRRDVDRRRRIQRASAAQGVVRRRSGRHARRPEAPLGPRRSARSEASLHRHVERRRVRVDRRRRATGHRSTRA